MNAFFTRSCRATIFLLTAFLFCFKASAQYDDCASPQIITIPNNGFGLGTFSSTPVTITAATVQSGETFAPAILVAGQTQKSVWFKFTLPTTRNVKVILSQDGTSITAGDVGFAVYKNATCLPTNAMISNKLTPLPVFGNTTHPCTEPGDYLVQVSAKAAAAGNVVVQVQTAFSTAAYDRPAQAYDFGTLGSPNFTRYIDYSVDCQSVEDAAEKCTAISKSQEYTKSTWHVFKTPAYFDYISVLLAGTGSPTYFVNSSTLQKFGYNLYAGDVRTTGIAGLTLVKGCDSLQSNGYVPDYKIYKCTELQPNTVYTVQLFHHKDFEANIRLAVTADGLAPTKAPEPVASLIPASNKMGVLPASAAGITTTLTDQLGCNAVHSLHPCNALPAGGYYYLPNRLRYNLSTFFTFTLSNTCKLTISGGDATPPSRYNSAPFLIKIYKQDIGATCNVLDTTNLAFAPFFSNAGFTADCVPPGNYTVQVLGRDTAQPISNYNYSHLAYTSYVLGLQTDLGKKFNVSINVKTLQAINKFSLNAPSAVDSINRAGSVLQALVNNITYTSKSDTFGCGNTVRPFDTTCAVGNNKVIYREFAVADSGVLSVSTSNYFFHKLYKGDAQALAAAQNVSAYPDRISGLAPKTICLYNTDCDGTKVCVVPGTYTHLTFAGDAQIGQASQSSYRFNLVNTTYGDPAAPQNMGTLVPGASLTSAADVFSCKDNAIPINGFQPCTVGGAPATKAIYRQFYLSAPATLSINPVYNNCTFAYNYVNTLFRGKISDGLAGLMPVAAPFQCFNSASSPSSCSSLDSGWYTIVSYGAGPTYADPFRNNQNGNAYSIHVGRIAQITVSAAAACPGPKYNRPYKAAIDNVTAQPFLFQWAPRVGHTAAYPKTDTTYTLPLENFNCTVDTPFAAHPIPACSAGLVKVAYYVFRTTQEAYVKIDTKYFWAAVYAGNARTDSASFATATPVQSCLQSTGFIQLCNLQPGTYTLAVFAAGNQTCTNVQPTVYIDAPGGQSRFDYAAKAYDFGLVPPDSTYYSGKPFDVNPLNAGRAPSNDFIYCTTGAAATDPTDAACGVVYNANVYPARSNAVMFTGNMSQTPVRRNLWYTFVAEYGGYVRIRVVNKTPGKTGYQPQYAVYRSNVDGTLPFATVVASGQVDSTLAQGLSFVVRNNPYNYCYQASSDAAFYRDPCNSTKERYYIVVENPSTYPVDISGQQPNAQFEVSILIDSINSIQPKFDHYFQASNIGSNLGTGTYTGATDNYSCATKDATDPVYSYGYCANKTLWYKFSTNVTGLVRYRVMIAGASQYGLDQIQLLRETKAGDSTTGGLQYISPGTVSDAGFNWGQTCVSPGTYYLLLPGCGRINEYAYPVIKLVEQEGDFCSAPKAVVLNGAGTTSAAVTVDCHTIGTDYGEFNPTLTCPNGAVKGQYKTSWFRIDISGADTLDVTTFLTENTNALASDIKYRMMKGNCGAMQEQSCVQDAQTQDTYKCLVPGSYFVQVFTPVNKNSVAVTGTISLNLVAVKHADTCAPINNCLSTAAFIPQFDCTTADYVTFNNFSTYGSAIKFKWEFGNNGDTSNAVSPIYTYPALSTPQTYTVKLTATNTSCASNAANTATVTQTITIPARPNVQLPNDTTLCTRGTSLVLNATSWPGSTYQWQQNGNNTIISTGSTFTATTSGTNTYWVKVTYNGCVKRDTIVINSNPNTKILQTRYLCGNDSVLLNSTRGNGESFLWNTGQTTPSIYASVNGLYTNDVNWKGCVVKDSFNVLKAAEPWAKTDTSICYPFKNFTLNAATPGAINYSWQNGSTAPTFNVTAPGLYWVAINNGTCVKRDSIIVTTSAAPKDTSFAASICAGMGYTLPWGQVVNTSGTYRDTVRYAAGCDSLRRSVTVSFIAAATSNTAATVCNGQPYTLPWGQVVNSSGIYRDTLKSLSGCDSLVRTVNLTVRNVLVSNSNASVCASQTYTLPWGQVVNASGVYRDTVRYASGCDSLIRSVNLVVKTLLTQNAFSSICSGQSFTLPWGTVVNTAGVYRDTTRYISGCDSLIRSVTLTVNTALTQNNNASICAGQNYTLPWGTVVNTPGTYRDTVRYSSGSCDSLIRSITLSVKSVAQQTLSATVCSGNTYALPWGQVVTASGVYRDTLRYAAGCDSVQREVTVTVKPLLRQANNANICALQSYTLPWGTVVTAAGVYSDTVRYRTGCDSLIRSVTLRVDAPQSQNNSAVICNGQTYTLPWGATVSASGVYRDTLKYASGCDSLRRSVTLTVQRAASVVSSATVCSGQSYVLPWGQTVSASGTYRDTLHYATGCDSLMRQVNLTVKALFIQNKTATVCSGASYILPWGTTVNTTGIYRDTIRYTSGCDSLIRTVDLKITAPQVQAASPVICSNETYTLPWGVVVNTSGLYRDTIRGVSGCDSVVRSVTLIVKQQPVVRLSKSNDVNCMLGTTKLSATGGSRYLWSPSTGLSDSTIANPVASPSASTVYKVMVTGGNGCAKEDSIYVTVTIGNPADGYLVASAFTPNNDGKNDCFGISNWGDVKDLEFSVFNRWGQLVFYTSDKGRCWNGTVNGVIQKTDVYVYVIKAKTVCGPVLRKGTVTLIR